MKHKAAINGEIPGRPALYTRSIYAGYSHVGVDSFVKGDAGNAHTKMPGRAIKRQLAGHTRHLARFVGRRKLDMPGGKDAAPD